MICVFEHSDDFAGDELVAVAALDAELRLVVVRAVQAAVVHVEPVSRQTLAAFYKHWPNRPIVDARFRPRPLLSLRPFRIFVGAYSIQGRI